MWHEALMSEKHNDIPLMYVSNIVLGLERSQAPKSESKSALFVFFTVL